MSNLNEQAQAAQFQEHKPGPVPSATGKETGGETMRASADLAIF